MLGQNNANHLLRRKCKLPAGCPRHNRSNPASGFLRENFTGSATGQTLIQGTDPNTNPMQTGPPFPPPNAGVSSKSATWNQNIPAPGFGPADDEIFFVRDDGRRCTGC